MNEIGQTEVHTSVDKSHFDCNLPKDSAQLIKKKCTEINLQHLLTWDFIGSSENVKMPQTSSSQILERALVNDMLNIFLGMDGQYVKADPLKSPDETRTFRISERIGKHQVQLVEKLLHTASDYSYIVRFIEDNTAFSVGRVNQALATAFSEEIMKFMGHIVFLEEELFMDLSLMWSALQKDSAILSVMRQVCQFVKDEKSRGGATLTILHSCMANCLVETSVYDWCLRWTRVAAEPFLRTLEKWIFTGTIHDPFDEFMITEKEDSAIFSLRQEQTPQFLEKIAPVILETGIYMHYVTMSSCIIEFPPDIGYISYEAVETKYHSFIRKAYNFSNQTLMKILNRDDLTLRRLEFAKSLFCIEKGDLFYSIFETCQDHLSHTIDTVNFSTLVTLINESIHNSCLGKSQFSSDVHLHLERHILPQQLSNIINVTFSEELSINQTVLEALTFNFNVTWPQKLILDDETIKCYQMVFRHIFYIKYVFMKLTKLNIDDNSDTHFLKFSMIVFTESFLSYITVETIEPLWEEFKIKYRCTERVADIIKEHRSFIYKVSSACMLSSLEMYQQLRNIFEICLKFSSNPDSCLELEFNNALKSLMKKAVADNQWSSLHDALNLIFNIGTISESNDTDEK